MPEHTLAVTIAATAPGHDTAARRGPASLFDLDAKAASLATIWLICYLVIGLGWAVTALHLDTLFATVRIAVAH